MSTPLQQLSARLDEAHYNVESLMRIFGRGLLDVSDDLVPPLIRRCHEDGSKAARLLSFWILLQPMQRTALEKLLGKRTVSALLKWNLIALEDEHLYARVSLYPCLRYRFFADPIVSTEVATRVPWLGRSGYALAMGTPRHAVERSLDMGCGAGVQVVLQAAESKQCLGVDNYPAALEYARLNLALNGVEDRCTITDRMPDGEFDLITTMLAYAPSSESDLPWLRDLAGRLRSGGTLVLAVRHCTPDGPLLERVERWLGGSAGWGLGQLNHSSRHLLAPRLAPIEWVTERNIVDEGFQDLAEALVYIRKLKAGSRGWRLQMDVDHPHEQVSRHVEGWLDAQERFAPESWPSPSWESWRPRWSQTTQLLVDCREGLGMVRYAPHLFHPTALDKRDVFLLDQADGSKTAGDLVRAYAARWEQPLSSSSGEVAQRLGAMGRQVLVQ